MLMIKSKFYSVNVAFCLFVICILTGYYYMSTTICIPDSASTTHQEIMLDMTRLQIKLETWKYNFTYSNVNKLEDLLMESGGTPVRSLIVSTWRSGSTFLGELLNAMDSNFYHYEPFIEYESKQIRDQRDANKAVERVTNLFKCNFSNMENNFEFGKIKMHYGYFKFNTRLWEMCKNEKDLCVDANFTERYCKLFPFQSMKVVRLRLRYIENILDVLNVNVVLLIRDPRGVMVSRRHVDFCSDPDCFEPKSLCSDMKSDYEAANRLLQKYPDKIKVFRFEDLVLNLDTTTQELLRFLRLGPNQSIDNFLLSHTNVSIGNAYSTFRVSHNVAFKWKTASNFSYIQKVQEVCTEAMESWGYRLADNASHLASEDFYPLKPYSVYSNIYKTLTSAKES